MFKNAFKPDAWGTARQAYDAAHAFGYAFAWHFGPTHGTGDIRMLEVPQSIMLFSFVIVFVHICSHSRVLHRWVTSPGTIQTS